MTAGVEGKGLSGDPGLNEAGDHAVGGPRFLGARFESQSDLEWDGGKPEGMNARRVVWENGSEDRGLVLEADGHAASFIAVSFGEDIEWEASGEGFEDLAHVAKNEGVLLHVGAAHMFGEAGAGRLLPDEIGDGLGAITEGDGCGLKEIGGFGAAVDELIWGEGLKNFTGIGGFEEIFFDDPAVHLSDASDGFAGFEVDDILEIEGRVGVAPADGMEG